MPRVPDAMRQSVVFAEGSNDLSFIGKLLERLQLRGQVTLRSYDGKESLADKLDDLSKEGGFSNVARLLILRDADDDAAGAFTSVANAIRRLQWSPPAAHAEWSVGSNGPSCAVYVFPDGSSQGELETLLGEVLCEQSVAGCVDGYMRCLRESGAIIPDGHQVSKHRFLAIAASLRNPTASFGTIVEQNEARVLEHRRMAPLLNALRGLVVQA